MQGFVLLLLSLTGIGVLQILLSLRTSRYPGLIIPCIQLLGSVFLSMLFSDIAAALLGFIVSMIPMVLWLGIYHACRRKMGRKRQDEINRMRINDL
jgi:hypothetical protein